MCYITLCNWLQNLASLYFHPDNLDETITNVIHVRLHTYFARHVSSMYSFKF